eukprot:10043778-Lingulodinium_polyedra.AAC.1
MGKLASPQPLWQHAYASPGKLSPSPAWHLSRRPITPETHRGTQNPNHKTARARKKDTRQRCAR